MRLQQGVCFRYASRYGYPKVIREERNARTRKKGFRTGIPILHKKAEQEKLGFLDSSLKFLIK